MKPQIVDYVQPTIQGKLDQPIKSLTQTQVYTVPIGLNQQQFLPTTQFLQNPSSYLSHQNQIIGQTISQNQPHAIRISVNEYKQRMDQLINQIGQLTGILNENNTTNENQKKELDKIKITLQTKEETICKQALVISQLQQQQFTGKMEKNTQLRKTKDELSFEDNLIFENQIRKNDVQIQELRLKEIQICKLKERIDQLLRNKKAYQQERGLNENRRNFSSEKIKNKIISRQY